MFVLIGALILLIVGYVFYGGWLAKQWGVDPKRPTPAQEMQDGVDYVPAKPYVLLGHHFSSIAGAGPINGPIQAAVFGWVPVLLWVIIGGIFFGAVHDFGALFASLRHKGQTIASVIAENIDDTAKKLFCIFAYLTLVLVVAAFASIVANTFATGLANSTDASNLANQRTAMISMLFIVVAIIYGIVTRGRNIPTAANVISAIAIIVVLVAIGYNVPLLSLDYNTWMILLGVYIAVASVAPVWILLQPRDYLSSYLLYGMIALSVIGIIGASLTGDAANLQIPAFTDFTVSNVAVDAAGNTIIDPNTGKAVVNKAAASGFLFPALFITIACGAISGFHSLVASGTTSKQLDNEKLLFLFALLVLFGPHIPQALTLLQLLYLPVVFLRCLPASQVLKMLKALLTPCSSWQYLRSALPPWIPQPVLLATCSKSFGFLPVRPWSRFLALVSFSRTPTLQLLSQ